jgi:5'-deoxynucleotidase YfbR-like HD superfamily hydrolase
MNNYDRVTYVRRGMNTRRFHTVPSLDVNTVAHHSAGVALLITVLHPDPSAALLKATLTHDICEWQLGDVPAQVKWKHTAIASAWMHLEQEAERECGLSVTLASHEVVWLHCCDTLELMLYAMEQIRMGNRYFREVWERGLERMKTYMLPAEVADYYNQLMRNFVI